MLKPRGGRPKTVTTARPVPVCDRGRPAASGLDFRDPGGSTLELATRAVPLWNSRPERFHSGTRDPSGSTLELATRAVPLWNSRPERFRPETADLRAVPA